MFGSSSKYTNDEVVTDGVYERQAPQSGGDGEVHVIICALDYKGTGNELTCSQDGRNMEKLLEACGIQDVTAMYDNQCTKENVFALIQEVGGRCGPDDYFVFYYSGHGTNMEDQDGDEEDGQDEAFCFVAEDGTMGQETFMRDDDFATAVINAINDTVRVIVLTDCCHSGTIADLDKEEWGDIHAISITGCLDGQTSGDMGRGGIFTHSMLLAIDKLQDAGEEDYSVGLLYNACVEQDNKVFNSAQDITIQCTSAVEPNGMAWPLIPTDENYKAPISQAAEQGNGKLDPAILQQFGVPAHVAQFANFVDIPEGIDPEMIRMGADCLAKVTKGKCAIM